MNSHIRLPSPAARTASAGKATQLLRPQAERFPHKQEAADRAPAAGNRTAALGHRFSQAIPSGSKQSRNRTGLPDRLKDGVERLSGLSMDHVKVHYNSHRPAQLQALAYAQGREIHVAPGQEHHLPHEAWHIVQQAQGRVQPDIRLRNGVSINANTGLEQEAEAMGAKAMRTPLVTPPPAEPAAPRAMRHAPSGAIVQRNGFENLMSNPAVAQNILGMLPAGDLAQMRLVSKAFKKVADKTRVEGSPATMGDLTEHFRDYKPTGLHGTSDKDAPSLYGGVSMGHDSNWEGSKLGPGFYLTEGRESPEQRVAKYFAEKRVSKVGGKATIFRVLTRNLQALRRQSYDGPWLKTNPPSKELRPDHRGADLLSSNLSDLKHREEIRAAKELKIAPHMISPTLEKGVFPEHSGFLDKEGGALRKELEEKRKKFGVEVLPPSGQGGVLGLDFLNALHKRMKKK